MGKYHLEFILNMQVLSVEALKSSILEFGEDLEVCQLPQDEDVNTCDFKIRIHTEDPTVIFDTCAQFGRMKSVKINEKES